MCYDTGNNPCGFCEDGDLHQSCDAKDCTCSCPFGNKQKREQMK